MLSLSRSFSPGFTFSTVTGFVVKPSRAGHRHLVAPWFPCLCCSSRPLAQGVQTRTSSFLNRRLIQTWKAVGTFRGTNNTAPWTPGAGECPCVLLTKLYRLQTPRKTNSSPQNTCFPGWWERLTWTGMRAGPQCQLRPTPRCIDRRGSQAGCPPPETDRQLPELLVEWSPPSHQAWGPGR